MINFRGESRRGASRRAFLKSSTTAMVTWAVAPTPAIVPAVSSSGQAIPRNVEEKSRELTIEVAAGEYERQNTPVFFPLPGTWRDEQRLMLKRADTGELVDAQVESGPSPRLVWLIRDVLKGGQTRRYTLTPEVTAAPPLPVVASDDGRSLIVNAGGRPVLRYNAAILPAPDPQQSVYERSGYIYPLFNPLGQAVSDDFPPDHAHQHSVWFAWSKATFEGHELNCWEFFQGKGRIDHERLEESGGGAVFAHFTARLRHVDPNTAGGPKTALYETWKLLVYNLTEVFIFDVDLTQTCATQSPVQVLENSYGGLAIRGHRNWFDVSNSEYLTSEGKTRRDGNQTRPRWVDLHGWIDGKVSGISVLDHPDNFRFPQPVRLHPEKPYFCFAPPALGPFKIDPGNAYRSRYRFFVHGGRPDPGTIDRVWNDFAHPAQARMVKEGSRFPPY